MKKVVAAVMTSAFVLTGVAAMADGHTASKKPALAMKNHHSGIKQLTAAKKKAMKKTNKKKTSAKKK